MRPWTLKVNTLNDRVYAYLGSLGYTGTLIDRLGKYEYGGKKGWEGLVERFAKETLP